MTTDKTNTSSKSLPNQKSKEDQFYKVLAAVTVILFLGLISLSLIQA